MNINNTQQPSPYLSSQLVSQAREEAAVSQLHNASLKLEGQTALQLIQSVPAAQGNVGQNINIAV
jgi:hypothetical protein